MASPTRRLLLALLCVAAAASLSLGAQATGADADERKKVGVYELRMGDFSVKVTNWGARLMSVVLPDSKGNLADVVLGKDTVDEYFNDTSYFGPITGRVGQRISRGRFVLDGKVYYLERNDGENTIHGGGTAFSKSAWEVKEHVAAGDSPHVTFFYHSYDGEQGFPGSLDAYVTYRVSSSPCTLGVHMNATAPDTATPVNLLSHVYWNLAGHGSGDVLGHTLRLFASRYTVLDGELLPSGRVAPVAGTPLDFRAPAAIGARIREVTGGKVAGYDANYVVDGEPGAMRPVAQVKDGASGRAVELWANQATMQFYTGNWLNRTKGKGGAVYDQYAGFTLETMGYVDAVNHPEFPSQTLRPGQVYKHDMVLKFSF